MPSPRQELRLDHGWRFHLGEIDAPLSNRHIAAYMANKAGWARGAAKPSFDDSDWRAVNLPHDWSIEGDYSKDNHINAGYLPRGIGWYRRHFELNESNRGKAIAIRFDGISSHATIYLNGHLLARNHCGYTPAVVDITDVVQFGESLNVIAVRVDATSPEGWWYEGAGIYRHVWLTIASPLHIDNDGVFVCPMLVDSGNAKWNTAIEVSLRNRSGIDKRCTVKAAIESADGRVIGTGEASQEFWTMQSRTIQLSIDVVEPARWSLKSPILYRARVRVIGHDVEVVDEKVITFGYRTIRFDANEGFFLNEKPVKLKGTCNHQDHAGVGVAVPDSIHEFRIRRLLEVGSNAYRSAHNPPAPELLDACDRAGMLVMDENRNFGVSPEHIGQVRTMVRRDRNHPSVILWALCNEEAIQATTVGENIARTLAVEVRELDPTRPVTAAVSGGVLNEKDCIQNALDVMGVNYQIGTYDALHALRPTMPIVAAETHCVLSTRGVYETGGNYFDSFGEQKAAWGESAMKTWREVNDRPFVAGLFAWTGFDYRGEPTPLEWPSVTSHWGMLDLCGFEKDAFYQHKAYWSDEPFVHLAADWTSGPENSTRVIIYSNCDEVNLQNGKLLKIDSINMAECMLSDVPATVVGFRDGKGVAEWSFDIGRKAIELKLEIHPTMAAMLDGEDAPADGAFTLPITVRAVDGDSRVVPQTDQLVSFQIRGHGKIIGVGNGDPASHEADRGNFRRLFHGLAQVLVQTTTRSGRIELTARAEGLQPATLDLRSRDVGGDALFVPVPTVRRFVTDWRMSPVLQSPPSSMSDEIDAQDMNSWERFDPQKPISIGERGFLVYRASAVLPRFIQQRGGQIRFARLDPLCTVTFNGKPLAVNDSRIEVPSGCPAASSLVIVEHLDCGDRKFAGPVELLESE